MLEEGRKIEQEKQRKENEKQKRKVNHPDEKLKTKAKKSVAHVKSKNCTAASMVQLNTELNSSRKCFTGCLTISQIFQMPKFD